MAAQVSSSSLSSAFSGRLESWTCGSGSTGELGAWLPCESPVFDDGPLVLALFCRSGGVSWLEAGDSASCNLASESVTLDDGFGEGAFRLILRLLGAGGLADSDDE